jgi:hypothetical protein
MPRTKRAKSDFGARKPTYWEKLRAGTSHDTYDPREEGYGDANEWAACFNVRMGFQEAQDWKRSRRWGSDWKVIADMAGVHIDENSMWEQIRSAFRKAARNCHPDFVSVHGKDKATAEEQFKDISAAYTMLEDIYRSKGLLK